MARFIPPHPEKGSPEAKAWAEKMQRARRAKAVQIRRAGLKTEREFFGKKGILTHAQALKAAEKLVEHERASAPLNPGMTVFDYMTMKGWELTVGSRRRPRVFSRVFHGVTQVLQQEARGYWRLLEHDRRKLQTEPISIGVFPLIGDAVIRADHVGKNPGRPHGTFTRCVKHVKASLKRYHRTGDPKAICGAVLNPKTSWYLGVTEKGVLESKQTTKPIHQQWVQAFGPFSTREDLAEFVEIRLKRDPRSVKNLMGSFYKKNPITIVGNPADRINAKIEGVIYNRCIEIRAQKTAHGELKGFYRHPFSRSSQVCILALDNGDLLIHSRAGQRLWGRV